MVRSGCHESRKEALTDRKPFNLKMMRVYWTSRENLPLRLKIAVSVVRFRFLLVCKSGSKLWRFSDDARVTLYAEDELALDHFAVYRAPIPDAFQAGNGEPTIRVTLAFDPPVTHTRNDCAGLGTSFRLIRGCEPDLIFEHYRRREQAEDPFPELAAIQLSTCPRAAGTREGDRSICDRDVQARRRENMETATISSCVARAAGQHMWTGSHFQSSSNFCTGPKCSSMKEYNSGFGSGRSSVA
jgi:hypothetical protein